MMSTFERNRDELIRAVKAEAVQYGDFVLSSGEKSNYYLDIRRVTLYGYSGELVSSLMSSMLDRPIEAVGGMELGAIPIVSSLLAYSSMKNINLRGFIVRKRVKGHGTGKLIEGPVRNGDKALIVEDVTTTGQSAMQAVKAAMDFGVKVDGVISVLDRLNGATELFEELGIRYQSILTVKDVIDSDFLQSL